MRGYRKQRVASSIENSLNEIFLLERAMGNGIGIACCALRRVEISRDLRVANCYITPAQGVDVEVGGLLMNLRKATGQLRSSLAKRVQLRYVPELKFFYDESAERQAKIEDLLGRMVLSSD